MIRQGEIYLADLEGTVPHPVVVVSQEKFNRGDRVVVVLCTSTRFAARFKLPNCVPLRAGQFGMTKDCVATCENIFLVQVGALHPTPVGILDNATLREVIKAVGHVLASDCEPI